MTEMRKITAFVPVDLLEKAQAFSGEGVSETLRMGLRKLAESWAYKRLLELQGTIDLEADGVTLAMLRDDGDDEAAHRAA
jgi:hypothetical protein